MLETNFWCRIKYQIYFSGGQENLILPMLAYKGFHVRDVQWLYQNSRIGSASDVIVVSKWSHHVNKLLCAFWNLRIIWNSMVNNKKQKKVHCLCEDGIETAVPRITVWQHEEVRVLPNGDPRERFCYPALTFTMNSYTTFFSYYNYCNRNKLY